jgi:hypothetical protein
VPTAQTRLEEDAETLRSSAVDGVIGVLTMVHEMPFQCAVQGRSWYGVSAKEYVPTAQTFVDEIA